MKTKYRHPAASKRKSHQRKKAKLGHKSMRGQPELYDEMKQRYGLSLTPTAVSIIDHNADQSAMTRSEYIEKFLRKLERESGGEISSEEVVPTQAEAFRGHASGYA